MLKSVELLQKVLQILQTSLEAEKLHLETFSNIWENYNNYNVTCLETCLLLYWPKINM